MTSHLDPAWHLDVPTLELYLDGHAVPLVGASVESHLMRCVDCRLLLGTVTPADPLEDDWQGIRSRIEHPAPSVVERGLGRLGVSAESARLLTAVPAFRGAWLLGMFAAILFAGAAALFAGDYGIGLFLIVAPLAPVAGVAAAFGGDADPCHELVTVTPYPAVRMLLLRTGGVLVTSIPVAVLAGLALPGPAWLGIAWLTPAAAGVLLTLVLAPLFGTTVPTATFGACWSVGVLSAARIGDPLEVVEPAMQLLLGAVALGALAVLLLRYPSFDRLGRQS
jgi:hypothetical protein